MNPRPCAASVFMPLCIALYLAPLTAAPPQKGFVQGQPEMQQAMDNMVSSQSDDKRHSDLGNGYPALLTHKLFDLLSEAEHTLHRVKNFNERRWIEAFMMRLKVLSSSLDNNAQQKAQLQTSKSNVLNSSSNQIVPFLKSTLTESTLKTSDSSYHKTIHKSTEERSMSARDDDELVHELESLHNRKRNYALDEEHNKVSPPDPKKVVLGSSKKFYESGTKVDEKLKNEVKQLRLRGEADDDIIQLLPPQAGLHNGNKILMSEHGKRPHSEMNFRSSSNQLKMYQRKMANMNMNYWSPSFGKDIAENPTNLNNASNSLNVDNLQLPFDSHKQLAHIPYNYLSNVRLRHHGLQDAIQKLQGQGYPNHIRPQNHYKGHAPNNDKHNIEVIAGTKPEKNRFNVIEQKNKFYFKPNQNYGNLSGRSDKSPTVSPHLGYDFKPNFSEEMKRELRDGKVILLSDNVVHSNFSTYVDRRGSK